ncbi:oligopeptide transport system ATP-binding protein [Stella humosa]|uniref:Oligopeptide transport system ATP-binding protein n=1 Tax=Stella humosa TaxID=94 RepID=A0A3N1M2T1_9PROT|nr:ABC transporter ATP-binding protein [Stella humosa]ROQ00032.1 oligopeptide transport system ATP-binding protein [Stella humosa]BBK30736.1 ABC transporter ATP-binding protein [Stella humosa]
MEGVTATTSASDAGSAARIEVQGLAVHFPVMRGQIFRREVARVRAVDGVSFSIRRGETFGLVGESGCGKTTIARTLLKLLEPTGGTIHFDGEDVTRLGGSRLKNFRRRVQAIFQDPYSSLNPRMTVGDILAEPFIVHGMGLDRAARDREIHHLLDICGLPRRIGQRYPHEMSGGQRQRVGIARALALKPDLIVCDEAVSALDVSVQAQIVNLLEELQQAFGLTYLFIAHDLGVVRHLCRRVGVMYLGRLVEQGDADALFDRPAHPYTRALLSAVPVPDPAIEALRQPEPLPGEVPSPVNPPSGCVFHPRCPVAIPACAAAAPPPRAMGPDHFAACIRAGAPVPPAPACEGVAP